MQLTITLPDRETTIVRNRQRWAEVLADSQWADHPYRIEINAFGNILMTPPPGGPHCGRQFEIAYQLRRRLGGKAFTECPVSTIDGVRATDAAWFSSDRFEQVRGQAAFEMAPEICVEVLSPRNTEEEIRTKRELYFDAGAEECWVCDLGGTMSYYTKDGTETVKNESLLCPDFPNKIED